MAGPQTVITVVPNWNLRNDLVECLDSLAKSSYLDHQVIVVDNHSSDDSVAYVQEHYRDVIVIALAENRGYAAALNAGISCALSAGAGYVLVLNNDTVVPPDTISRLVKVLCTAPSIGVATPKVLNFYDPHRLYGLGDRSPAWLPLPRGFGYGGRDDAEKYSGLMDFDYVTGCAMLIPCSLFSKVGLFDESFFLFYEDSDFCRRVRDRGYRIVCAADARIYHKVSRSTGGKNECMTLRIRARNRIRFYRRYGHGPTPALTMLAILIVALFRVTKYCIRQPELVQPYVEGLVAGWREPLTHPVYSWPPPPCRVRPAAPAERVPYAP